MKKTALKNKILFVFGLTQFDQQFIEVSTNLGLSNYFTELDLDNCDIEDCFNKVNLVVKHIPELNKEFVEYNINGYDDFDLPF